MRNKNINTFRDLGILQCQHPITIFENLGTHMSIGIGPRTPRRSIDLQSWHVILLVTEKMDVARPIDKLITLMDETVVVTGKNHDRDLASPMFATKAHEIGLEPLDDIPLVFNAASFVVRCKITCYDQHLLALWVTKGIVKITMSVCRRQNFHLSCSFLVAIIIPHLHKGVYHETLLRFLPQDLCYTIHCSRHSDALAQAGAPTEWNATVDRRNPRCVR